MGILSRSTFREIASGAVLGVVLFTFVLFLQRLGSGKLFELLVRSAAPPSTVAYLFLLVLPFVLTFTVPVGVLVGVLIGLSRLSSDGEITAMRASGVPSRKVVAPVLTFALAGMAVTASASLWLTPLSIREQLRMLNKLAASQMTAEIQPRVFEEQFPRTILYVRDVIPGPVVRWKKMFIADLTPPDERKTGSRETGDTPRITVASEAIAVSDPVRNRIQLSMVNVASLEAGKSPDDYYISQFPTGMQVLEAERPSEIRARAFIEMDTGPLYKAAYRQPDRDRKSRTEAKIELNQRLAMPLACLLLALVGIPLGVTSRKGGKSAAFVLTVFLAFVYYMGLVSLIRLAQQGTLPVELAIWTPNLVFAVLGIALLARLETPGDRDIIGKVRVVTRSLWQSLRKKMRPRNGTGGILGMRLPVLPQVLDGYILSSFLFYFLLLLSSFVLMTEVYNFFELLSDVIKNNIPWSRVLAFLVFLAPHLIYVSTPVSVLVAVLVTFGVLTKNNEVTAFKSCGVSLYRMAAPVLIASMVLSATLFAFDHYYVPEANRKQDALRNEIKGRPVQTYLRPDRKWIFGQGSRIYYYKFFQPEENVMGNVSVYELDPQTYRLRRHISAERARWEPSLNTWIFQNGWARDIDGIRVTKYTPFPGQTATFSELNEPPGYFLREAKQDKQMNFLELRSYIGELRQSGFDTIRLQVQYHKKFAVPLFALIMALISIPFAFLTGNRGAMAGVGVSFGIAIAYWTVNLLFESIGNVNQLPPTLAAWSPDAVFALAGLYLMARMRT